ncbi:MAG: hypothetical protein ACLTUM_03650 [Christensenellales bacterium]
MNKINIMTAQCVEPDSALSLFYQPTGSKRGGEFAKKAEIANILFNIMSEQRAKRGYKCRKEIAAFLEEYEQRRRHGGVKRDGKKNGKRC